MRGTTTTRALLACLISVVLLAGCTAGAALTPAAPPVPSATAAPSAPAVASASVSPAPTPKPLATPVATRTVAPTAAATPAPTPSPNPVPAVIWVKVTSKYNGVVISYPADTTARLATSKAANDEIDSPAYAYLTVGQNLAFGFPSAASALAEVAVYEAKAKPDGTTALHLDKISSATMGGAAARRILIHAAYKGVKEYWVKVIAVKGSVVEDGVKGVYVYEIWLTDQAGNEQADLALANQFASRLVIRP